MRRQIISHYDYLVRYGKTGLSLAPGVNLVEEDLWAETRSASPRLSGQLVERKVADEGLYVTIFVEGLKKEVLSPDLLTSEEARQLVKKVKDKALLRALLAEATRGGVRAALQAAVEK